MDFRTRKFTQRGDYRSVTDSLIKRAYSCSGEKEL